MVTAQRLDAERDTIQPQVGPSIHQIRNGVGVFAPQYGPRRSFFGGIAKEL